MIISILFKSLDKRLTSKLFIGATRGVSSLPAVVFLISSLLVLASFHWQGNKGFSLWDEGFLWYGVQRVLLGEVPIRDFMSYDPGRYYWSAALVSIFGDNGIMSVRSTVAIFQVMGLFVGLLLIAQSKNHKSRVDIVFWFLSAATLVMWMFPRHKLFDISLSIFLIGILTFLIRNPTPRRYFISGVCVGLIAVFGRNHGLYGVIGSLGVIAWLSIKDRTGPGFMRVFLLWCMGVLIGYLPIILMILLTPGFANALWESIRFQFERGSTNLSLPIPWPWTVKFAIATLSDSVRSFLIGLFFIGTVVFAVLSILWVVLRKLKEKSAPPAVVASAFLAFPYAHFAFSRADIGHLAQGIFPLLIGCLVLLALARSKIKWPLVIILCGASFWVMHVFHPGWHCFASKQCVSVEIAGRTLQVHPSSAKDIALLRQLNDQYTSNGETFIAAPFWPGAYALLERKSPMWTIYALWLRREDFQRNEIERIKTSKPAFALILDLPLDGREDLRFKNTNPLVNDYILNNFEPLPILENSNVKIYLKNAVE